MAGCTFIDAARSMNALSGCDAKRGNVREIRDPSMTGANSLRLIAKPYIAMFFKFADLTRTVGPIWHRTCLVPANARLRLRLWSRLDVRKLPYSGSGPGQQGHKWIKSASARTSCCAFFGGAIFALTCRLRKKLRKGSSSRRTVKCICCVLECNASQQSLNVSRDCVRCHHQRGV
jgi:hypothetical protein